MLRPIEKPTGIYIMQNTMVGGEGERSLREKMKKGKEKGGKIHRKRGKRP